MTLPLSIFQFAVSGIGVSMISLAVLVYTLVPAGGFGGGDVQQAVHKDIGQFYLVGIHNTRIVWITLLAAMDRDGIATFSSVHNLARRANVTLQAALQAVEILEAPDPDSCSQECNGKRIERIDGGWLVINATTYRGIIHSEDVRKQTRKRVQKYRERQRALGNACNVTVTQCNAAYASVSVPSSEEKGSTEGKRRAKSLQEVLDFCAEKNIPSDDGKWFWESREGCGWTNNGRQIKNWEATLSCWWRSGGILPSQKNSNNHNNQKPHDQPFRGFI